MALSDALYEASDGIRIYIKDGEGYSSELLSKCNALCNMMDAIRLSPGLDFPPEEAFKGDPEDYEYIKFHKQEYEKALSLLKKAFNI